MHVDPRAVWQFSIVHRTLPAMNIGGGVTGFLTQRVGIELGYPTFQHPARRRRDDSATASAREQLSFWRATMAVAVRY